MNQTAPVVASWGDAIFVALTGALNDLLLFLPRLLGALLILLVGRLLAKAVEALVAKGLRAVRFNRVADRAELDQFLDRAGVRLDPASVVGKPACWFLMLIFIGAAFNAFGLTQVNAVVGMLALAGALAFGLGGRDVAARILEDWYARRGEAADRAGRLADAVRREAPAAGGTAARRHRVPRGRPAQRERVGPRMA